MRSLEGRKHTRIAPLIVIGGSLAWATACGSPTAPPDSEQSAVVGTVEIVRGAVRDTIATLGSVEFDPDRTRTLAFIRAGQVSRVFVTAGEAVRKGQPLVALGPVPADSLDAKRARIDLDFAERELERVRKLRSSNLATNADVQNAERAVATNRAAVVGLGGANGAKSQATQIEAPDDGVVLQLAVTAGSLAQAGSTALVLGLRGGLVVRAGFERGDAVRLRPGADVEVEAVFGHAGDAPARAELPPLHEVIDAASQLSEVLIRFPDPPGWMVAGARVRVHATAQSSGDAVVVPRAALLTRDGTTGVFVIEGGSARWRPIELGVSGEESVEARQGLQAGAIVATTGRSSLSDGMHVRSGDAASPR